MTRLYLIRHAEAEGNIIRVFQGHTDADITENGAKQLKALEKRFSNIHFDAIYSSDLKRAYKTAEAVNSKLNLPIVRKKELREIYGGKWENVKWHKIPELFCDEYHCWENVPHKFRMPEGESFYDLLRRVKGSILKIIKQHRGKVVCVVTHGAAIRAFMTYIKGCTIKELNSIDWYENTSVTIIDFDDNLKPVIVSEGDDSHLHEDITTLRKQSWYKKIINDKDNG